MEKRGRSNKIASVCVTESLSEKERDFLTAFASHLADDVNLVSDPSSIQYSDSDLICGYGSVGVGAAEKAGLPYYPLEYPKQELVPHPTNPRKVVVFGPESSCKTVIVRALAEHFNDVYTQEYARIYMDYIGRACRYEDLEVMGRGLIAYEETLLPYANKMMACDTLPLTTGIWSQVLFNRVCDWFQEVANHRHYDLYLMTALDIPFIYDPQRCFPEPEERQHFATRIHRQVCRHGLQPVILSGSPQQRIERAIQEVRDCIGSG